MIVGNPQLNQGYQPPQQQEEKKKKLCCGCIECTPCRWCCCVCCCVIITFIIAIILAFIIIAATFQKPTVDFTGAKITNVTFAPPTGIPNGVTATTNLMFHIKNPNGPPGRIKLTTVSAEVYSVDYKAADTVGTPYDLGLAQLQDNLELQPKSETDFTIVMATTLTPSSGPVFQWMLRDCGPTGPVDASGNRNTKIRVILNQISIEAGRGRSIDVPVDGKAMDQMVPCGKASLV